MKATKQQLAKINKKASEKYPELNVVFTFHGQLQAKYTDLKQSSEDEIAFKTWNSLIANAESFDDVYYSI